MKPWTRLARRLGPLIVAFVLYRHGGYHHAFAILLIPALLCLAVLAVACALHRRPEEMEYRSTRSTPVTALGKPYRLYLVAGALVAAGFADFSLIAFHFQQAGTIAPDMVPVLYAMAMATAAISALVLGRLLDKLGIPILLAAFAIPAFFAPLVFLGGRTLDFVGMILWGIGLGAMDSCLKAALAPMIPPEKRGTAFGLFDTVFGVAWFAGSATMGLLYDKSPRALVLFSVVLQLLALPVFAAAHKAARR